MSCRKLGLLRLGLGSVLGLIMKLGHNGLFGTIGRVSDFGPSKERGKLDFYLEYWTIKLGFHLLVVDQLLTWYYFMMLVRGFSRSAVRAFI